MMEYILEKGVNFTPWFLWDREMKTILANGDLEKIMAYLKDREGKDE